MDSQSIIEKAKSASRTLLNEIEAKALLSEGGIPVVETMMATSRQEVVAISKKFGFPVVLKIVSRAAGGQRATVDVWISAAPIDMPTDCVFLVSGSILSRCW